MKKMKSYVVYPYPSFLVPWYGHCPRIRVSQWQNKLIQREFQDKKGVSNGRNLLDRPYPKVPNRQFYRQLQFVKRNFQKQSEHMSVRL